MDSSQEYSDQNLISSVKAGGKGLLKEFYLQQSSAFSNWLEKTFPGLGEEEIKDLYQDAILIMVDNIRAGKLDELQSSCKTYFFAIAKHLVYKRFDRKSKIEKEEKKLTEQLRFNMLDQSGDELSAKAAELVRNMDEPCKSILLYAYYENLKAATIAEKMDYADETVVRNQKSRCMKRLKEMLTPYVNKQ